MPQDIHHSWLAPRRAVTIALALATAGLALPYGRVSPGVDEVTHQEWGLHAIALLAFLGLVVDFWPGLNQKAYTRGWAFLAAGFCWATATVYDLIVVNETPLWHFAHGLDDLGWMVLALFVWRYINQRRKNGVLFPTYAGSGEA